MSLSKELDNGNQVAASYLIRASLPGSNEEGGSPRERFAPCSCVVIASFSRELARIFFPFLAGRISVEKDRQFFFGKLTPIRPGISFGDAMTFEKLDYSNVFTCWVFVHVCCDAVAIWLTRIDRLSEKRVDLLLGIAEAGESLASQSDNERGC
jgi:hypothetical protein